MRNNVILAGVGLLGGLAFAPVGAAAFACELAFLAYMFKRRESWRAVFALGFIQACAAYSWLWRPFTFVGQEWASPIAIALLAAYMALWFALASVAARRGGALKWACAIGLFEWARGWFLTGFPWNPIAASLHGFEGAWQAMSLVGTYGLSVAAAYLAASWTERQARIPAAGLWIAIVAFGLLRSVPEGAAFTARLMDAGQENPLERDPLKFEKYAMLARGIGAEGVDLFVAPESASDYDLARDEGALSYAASWLLGGQELLLGWTRIEAGRIYNTLGAVGAGGLKAAYDKRHLVPFGEYVPLRGVLPFEKFTEGIVDFSAGEGARELEVSGKRALPLICYEAAFAGQASRGRPDFIASVSNDAWFGGLGKWQHFTLARMRAVEEGAPMVRAANSGISGAVGADGRVIAAMHGPGSLDAKVPARTVRPTLYSLTGNWLFVILALGGLLWRKREN